MSVAVTSPFRGTSGSIHDPSFIGDVGTECVQRRRRLGRALDVLEGRDEGVVARSTVVAVR